MSTRRNRQLFKETIENYKIQWRKKQQAIIFGNDLLTKTYLRQTWQERYTIDFVKGVCTSV